MFEIPEVHYARSGSVRIAYQVFGDGPPTVVVPALVSNLEVMWEHEYFRRAFEHFGDHVKAVQLDKRGMGLSDRLDRAATVEERVGDVLAVMDDLGWETAHVLGISEGGAIARYVAAMRTDRVETLSLVNTMAPFSEAERLSELNDDTQTTQEQIAEELRLVCDTWGEDIGPFAALFIPGKANDRAYCRWMNRFNRLAASPEAFIQSVITIPTIATEIPAVPESVPCTIVHLTEDRLVPVRNGRFLAEQNPHAKYVEIPGTDHFFVGTDNWRDVLDPVIEQITGKAATVQTTRRFAAVLFTDIVDSTQLTQRFGSEKWREKIEAHDATSHRTVAAFGGKVVKSTGDGVLCTFDTPSQAVAAASALKTALAELELPIRAGIHAGEIEVHANSDISGIAVNLAARVESAADPNEIFVTSSMREMLLGSEFALTDRGEYELKGMDGLWRLFSVS